MIERTPKERLALALNELDYADRGISSFKSLIDWGACEDMQNAYSPQTEGFENMSCSDRASDAPDVALCPPCKANVESLAMVNAETRARAAALKKVLTAWRGHPDYVEHIVAGSTAADV